MGMIHTCIRIIDTHMFVYMYIYIHKYMCVYTCIITRVCVCICTYILVMQNTFSSMDDLVSHLSPVYAQQISRNMTNKVRMWVYRLLGVYVIMYVLRGYVSCLSPACQKRVLRNLLDQLCAGYVYACMYRCIYAQGFVCVCMYACN